MQFLLQNRLNGCQILERFGFLKTKSEPKFGFPHIPMDEATSCFKLRLNRAHKRK